MSKPSYDQAAAAGWVSIAVNAALFALKYWAGIVTGSIALIADAWHTLSDSLSSIVLLLGLKVAKKPADKDHPFGHGRAELIAALIIGGILAVIGINFLIESIRRLQDHTLVQYGLIAKVVTIVSILAKEALAQYAFRLGRRTNTKSLIADGWHHRSDALSSVIILTGIFLGGDWWWIDGVLGIIVSLLIFYATYEIFSGSVHKLLGEKPDEKTFRKIKEITYRVSKRELFLHHMHIHTYGDHKEVTFHIRLPKEMTLEEAHDIATKIEHTVREELAIQATIHMEPLHETKGPKKR